MFGADRPKRALVTGATGFIGRRLVEALLARGVAVIALSRSGERAPADWRIRGVDLKCGDLLDASTVRGLCAGADIVFHLASHPERVSAKIEDAHFALSVKGTETLLNEANRSGVRRFVFASSVKAMGEVTHACVAETMDPRPVSSYGRAKLAAEVLIRDAGKRSGIVTCSLRLPMVYGPNPAGSIMRMIEAVDRRWFPPLPEMGNKRSMVHVDDVTRALWLAADTPAASGQTYLVTDREVYSTRLIYEAICRALGKSIPKRAVPIRVLSLAALFGDFFTFITGKNLPLNRSVLEKLQGSAWYSSEKIQRELGYSPAHTLYSALPDMVSAYRTDAIAGGVKTKRAASAVSR